MNRTRCPWCGKTIDKNKDKMLFKDVYSPAVPQFLHISNCNHCGHKYGQVPLWKYVVMIGAGVLLLIILAFIFQSPWLFIGIIIPVIMFSFMPFSKLNDDGKICEINTDLLCKIEIIEKYQKIKCDEIYFLNDNFDDFNPFSSVSPISIYKISKNYDILFGEFLYMNEKNYDYINKDFCFLYDTQMNLAAKIKFII